MDLDISKILADWPYEPGKVSVRRIRGADKRDKIQLRLDLGLLQMETTGRPDGARPHGCESLLAHCEHDLQRFKETHGGDDGYQLDGQACEDLRAEGVMYYHRYLAEFVLEDYAAVERDTKRNLRLMDFCRSYGAKQSDRDALEQYRPYVLMMCTRAQAQGSLRDGRPKDALAAVHHGMENIEQFYRTWDEDKLTDKSGELSILRVLAKEIEGRIPLDPVTKLRNELDTAVSEERYEEAAVLRDQIRKAQVGGENVPGED